MSSFTDNNETRDNGIGAYVTLRSVVMGAIRRTGDHSMNEYFELLQFGIDFIREKLRMYHNARIEVAYILINEAGVIEFPSDMADYVKIGIPINGQLYILTVNDNMLINRAQRCGTDIRQMYTGNSVPILNDGFTFVDHFYNGRFVSGLYGVGGGFNTAYFRVDYTNRRIEFDGVIPRSEIVMEYKSTGIGPGTMIAPYEIAPIRTYILAEKGECDPSVSNTEKARRWKKHEEEVEMMRTFVNMPKMQEIKDILYASYKQSPKR